MRRYPLQHVLNMRDLGGYPTADGRVTRYGRILRSDEPATVSPAEIEMLKSVGLTCAIDLRSVFEARRTPSAFDGVPGITSYLIELDPSETWAGGEDNIAEIYAAMVENNPPLAQVMRTIAEADGSVLYHCAAGKDRTGVISALLLGLAGVSEADIIADYQVSATYLAPVVQAIHQQRPNLPAFFGQSKPEYMAAFLAWLYGRYGSAQGCLLQAGLTPQELQALKNKLLEE